jgi:predicted nucleic acid-binding protein
VVPQVLYEYWSVATRPVAQNGLGITAADAAADLAAICQRFHLFRDERAILDRWQNLVLQHQVLGKHGHDARLVAAMERHGIAQILTFNTSDFRQFTGISVLDPAQVAAGAAP